MQRAPNASGDTMGLRTGDMLLYPGGGGACKGGATACARSTGPLGGGIFQSLVVGSGSGSQTGRGPGGRTNGS